MVVDIRMIKKHENIKKKVQPTEHVEYDINTSFLFGMNSKTLENKHPWKSDTALVQNLLWKAKSLKEL